MAKCKPFITKPSGEGLSSGNYYGNQNPCSAHGELGTCETSLVPQSSGLVWAVDPTHLTLMHCSIIGTRPKAADGGFFQVISLIFP